MNFNFLESSNYTVIRRIGGSLGNPQAVFQGCDVLKLPSNSKNVTVRNGGKESKERRCKEKK